MISPVEKAYDLIQQALGLPDGPIRVAVVEQAVQLADASGDIDWQFYARHELIRSAFCGGEPEKLLVNLSWCLAKCDERGGCFDQSSLLWGCKYALSYITCFPNITRGQIEKLQDEVTDRFRKFGASMRTPCIYGMLNQLRMGYPQPAADYRRGWHAAPKDEFSESPAWERYFESWYLRETGEVDRALELALPALEGREPTEDVYHWLVDLFLIEFLKRRDLARAAELLPQAYRICRPNPKFVSHIGTHILFLTLTSNHALAVRLLERHLPWALHSRVPTARCSFFLSAWATVVHLERAGQTVLRLRVPEDFALRRSDGQYPCAALAEWFAAQTRELAARFDERNGTTQFTENVAKTLELHQWAMPRTITLGV